MKTPSRFALVSFLLIAATTARLANVRAAGQASASSQPATAEPKANAKQAHAEFHTSDRCVACHNGLKTPAGQDISIGYDWTASVMANSGRDPYWQGSVRRETIDHPSASAAIQNECSTCHIPMQHFIDRAQGRQTEVFSQLTRTKKDRAAYTPASDGVSCSVCHQIAKDGLGTEQTFNGNVVIASSSANNNRPEYGPFIVTPGHQRVMQSSTQGFVPQQGDHMRDAALCGSCHTLYTNALGPNGETIARFPEQMPYHEWQHSDYAGKQTCQECHMPVVTEPVAVTAIYGEPREGMHRHVFVGGNFVLQNMLNHHRDDLAVKALPELLQAASARTADYLRTQAASVTLANSPATPGALAFDVTVVNRSGHKLPTAYPSRRVWLHVTVRDPHGSVVFESGHLNPDGSIAGNPNDADPLTFEPHHAVITSPSQVEIFEPILKDQQGRVTTGLISAVDYIKDNRILPAGFDKNTADHNIRTVGDAATDPNFTAGSARIRYQVNTSGASGPFKVEVEVIYQPVGFRWAHNLGTYNATEPQRFLTYYDQEAAESAVILAHTEAVY